MNERTARIIAEGIRYDLGDRARVWVKQCPAPSLPDRFMVSMIVDNHLHLGFAEPYQWVRLANEYNLAIGTEVST